MSDCIRFILINGVLKVKSVYSYAYTYVDMYVCVSKVGTSISFAFTQEYRLVLWIAIKLHFNKHTQWSRNSACKNCITVK